MAACWLKANLHLYGRLLCESAWYGKLLCGGKGAKCELMCSGNGAKCEYHWKNAVWWQRGKVWISMEDCCVVAKGQSVNCCVVAMGQSVNLYGRLLCGGKGWISMVDCCVVAKGQSVNCCVVTMGQSVNLYGRLLSDGKGAKCEPWSVKLSTTDSYLMVKGQSVNLYGSLISHGKRGWHYSAHSAMAPQLNLHRYICFTEYSIHNLAYTCVSMGGICFTEYSSDSRITFSFIPTCD